MLKCAGVGSKRSDNALSQVDFVPNFGPTVVQYAEGPIFMKSFTDEAGRDLSTSPFFSIQRWLLSRRNFPYWFFTLDFFYNFIRG